MRSLTVLVLFMVTVPAWGGLLIVGQDYQLPIPAQLHDPGQMPPARLWVDSHVSIIDLDIKLNIEHTEVGDLVIRLTSPSGTTATLKQSWLPLWRQNRPNMIDTILDDEAPLPLKSGQAPYTGRFRPEVNPLSLFDGEDAGGWWTLNIDDPIYYDYGQLNRWELHITHAPEPSMLTLAITGLLYCQKRRTHP